MVVQWPEEVEEERPQLVLEAEEVLEVACSAEAELQVA